MRRIFGVLAVAIMVIGCSGAEKQVPSTNDDVSDLVGLISQSWKITDLNYLGNGAAPVTEGSIIFNEDGTFNLDGISVSNSFAYLAGPTIKDDQTPGSNTASIIQNYEIVDDSVIYFHVYGTRKDGTAFDYGRHFGVISMNSTRISTEAFILNQEE